MKWHSNGDRRPISIPTASRVRLFQETCVVEAQPRTRFSFDVEPRNNYTRELPLSRDAWHRLFLRRGRFFEPRRAKKMTKTDGVCGRADIYGARFTRARGAVGRSSRGAEYTKGTADYGDLRSAGREIIPWSANKRANSSYVRRGILWRRRAGPRAARGLTSIKPSKSCLSPGNRRINSLI